MAKVTRKQVERKLVLAYGSTWLIRATDMHGKAYWLKTINGQACNLGRTLAEVAQHADAYIEERERAHGPDDFKVFSWS